MIKKSPAKKPKAAVYIRVSTEEQAREGYSLSAQESALKDYIGMMGYDLYKVYKDEGKSAKDIKHRPALQQLLKDAEKKYFKAICVYKLDRFSRSLKDLILTIEHLKKLNIDFISLQDKIETASASGKLMFHIISSFAEFERDIISERTRFGMAEKAKEGGIITKAPMGYKIQDGKLLINPEKSIEVQKLFKEFVDTNQSLNKLSQTYNLSVMGLIKVLKNRTYIGEIKFKDCYLGTHEILIDKELFEKAQLKLDTNSYEREYLRNKNFLQGLNPELDNGLLDELAFGLSKKSIICERKELAEGEEDVSDAPTDKELSEIPSPYSQKKYFATRLLLDEGFIAEDISYNRMFVNADKTDVYANGNDRKIYVDCTPINLHKLMEYLHSDIEYWLILGEDVKEMTCYAFKKSE